MNERLNYVYQIVRSKATNQTQLNKLYNISWGVFKHTLDGEGVIEHNANFYYYSINDRMTPIFFGPMKVNTIIGYLGMKLGVDVQEYKISLYEILQINKKNIVGYDNFLNMINNTEESNLL